MSMIVRLVGDHHIDLHSRHPVSDEMTCLDLVTSKVELGQFPAKVVDGHAGTHACAERHVAADTRERIEVRYLHALLVNFVGYFFAPTYVSVFFGPLLPRRWVTGSGSHTAGSKCLKNLSVAPACSRTSSSDAFPAASHNLGSRRNDLIMRYMSC